MKKWPHRFKVQNLKSNITIFLLAVHWYFLLFFYPIPGRQAGSLFQYDEVNPQKIYIIPESASLVLPDFFFSKLQLRKITIIWSYGKFMYEIWDFFNIAPVFHTRKIRKNGHEFLNCYVGQTLHLAAICDVIQICYIIWSSYRHCALRKRRKKISDAFCLFMGTFPFGEAWPRSFPS